MLLQLKGGSGKSTIGFHVAAELHRRGRAVALLDADPQQSAVIMARRSPPPFDVRPALLDDPSDTRTWARSVLAVHAQYLTLDLPPHIAEVTEAAAGIADLALIPVRASLPDLDATRPTLDLVRDARSIRSDKGPRVLLVPSAVDRRTAAGREIADALLDLGEPVAPSIGQRTAYADAWAAGTAVAHWLPGSPAAAEIAALVDAIE